MEIVSNSLGDFSGGDTPGSIPNPVVKPASADGTWGVAPWESRSLPREFFFVGVAAADRLFCLRILWDCAKIVASAFWGVAKR